MNDLQGRFSQVAEAIENAQHRNVGGQNSKVKGMHFASSSLIDPQHKKELKASLASKTKSSPEVAYRRQIQLLKTELQRKDKKLEEAYGFIFKLMNSLQDVCNTFKSEPKS